MANDEAVDMLGSGHVLQGPGQTIDQLAQGAGLFVAEIPQAGDMPLRLGHQIPPIHRPSRSRMGVSGIDQVVLEEHSTDRALPHRVLGADEALDRIGPVIHA